MERILELELPYYECPYCRAGEEYLVNDKKEVLSEIDGVTLGEIITCLKCNKKCYI